MFPYRPDPLGEMPPIPAVATLASVGSVSMESLLAEVEGRAATFLEELQPRTTIGQFLVRRAALHSVRLERLARYNAAMTAQRIRRSGSEFEQNRRSEVDHLHSWLAAEPAVYARRLRQSPEGVDKLIDSWVGLRGELLDPDFPRWSSDHRHQALSLTGRRASDIPVSPITIYSDAYTGVYSSYVEKHPELAPLSNSQRTVVAGEQLLAIIDAEIAQLRRERAAFDMAALERDRLEAAQRALFDSDPAAKLAHRYEIATERNMHRALDTAAEIEATFAPDVPPESRLAPDDLAEPATNPLDVPPQSPPIGPIGRRSRKKVAVIKAAAHAQADRTMTTQPPQPTPPTGFPRRRPPTVI